jgi:hypothetical protein
MGRNLQLRKANGRWLRLWAIGAARGSTRSYVCSRSDLGYHGYYSESVVCWSCKKALSGFMI